jgi:hypothetical protein
MSTSALASAPASLSFPATVVGLASASRHATLTNTGDAKLEIPGSSFTGEDPDEFTVVSDGCSSRTLALHGDSCTIVLRFVPVAVGAGTAVLRIDSNAPGGSLGVPLDGIGNAPAGGATGPAGQAGTPGTQGPPGQAGATGSPGATGPQGLPGQSGATGAQGPVGAQGAAGVQGGQGQSGANGTPGTPGAQGPSGPAGRDASVTCKVPKAKKGQVKVSCTVSQAGASRQSSRAAWRLARGKRTVARGGTNVRRGRLALDLAHLPGVHRGRYVLTVRIGATVVREVVHVR